MTAWGASFTETTNLNFDAAIRLDLHTLRSDRDVLPKREGRELILDEGSKTYGKYSMNTILSVYASFGRLVNFLIFIFKRKAHEEKIRIYKWFYVSGDGTIHKKAFQYQPYKRIKFITNYNLQKRNTSHIYKITHGCNAKFKIRHRLLYF